MPSTPRSPDAAQGRDGVPPMPEGFSDRAAWDAIHWRPSKEGSVMDDAVIGWQRDNQGRVRAAMEAERSATCDGSSECKAALHLHGCFADEGNCDEPAEHYDVEGVMA